MKRLSENQKLANRIARAIFTNARQQRGWVLKSVSKDGRDLGGWCEKSVADLIVRQLDLAKQRKEKP